MVETRTHRRVTRNRKKNRVPLAKLRTAEVVRTVVDHPGRLNELVALLDDSERALRGRAAATLARLSESHAHRLIRVVDRLREALSDDSAYVRSAKAAEEWKNAAEKAELKNDAFPVVDWAASRTLRQFLQGHK